MLILNLRSKIDLEVAVIQLFSISPIRLCLRGSYLLLQKVRVDVWSALLGARFLGGPGPRAPGAPGGLPSLARSPVPGGPVSLACLSLAFSFPSAFL